MQMQALLARMREGARVCKDGHAQNLVNSVMTNDGMKFTDVKTSQRI
jgi:hypothetical protein